MTKMKNFSVNCQLANRPRFFFFFKEQLKQEPFHFSFISSLMNAILVVNQYVLNTTFAFGPYLDTTECSNCTEKTTQCFELFLKREAELSALAKAWRKMMLFWPC